MSQIDVHLNPGASPRLDLPARTVASPIDFHRSLPGYAPTALTRADGVARRLGVAEVWVKEESDRFGLPAYKVLGASWAIVQALLDRTGGAGTRPRLDELRAELTGSGPTLVAATDGNHGRAVARVARWLGLDSDVYVPRGMADARIEAIRGEGARVRVHPGTYDEAVRAAAASRGEKRLLIQDTAWPGYERVPAWIVEGYGTIFREVDAQLTEADTDAEAYERAVGRPSSEVRRAPTR